MRLQKRARRRDHSHINNINCINYNNNNNNNNMNWSFICTIVIRCKNDGTSASWKPVLTYFFTLVVYFTLKLYFFFFKSGPFPASFLFIFVFSVQLIINKCSIKFCRWLEANRGPLVLKATALPTEPQPLPNKINKFKKQSTQMWLRNWSWLSGQLARILL